MKHLKIFEKFVNERINDSDSIQEHDIVELIEDLSKVKLFIGDIGTVVHIYPNAKAYAVEFENNKVETVKPHQIKKRINKNP